MNITLPSGKMLYNWGWTKPYHGIQYLKVSDSILVDPWCTVIDYGPQATAELYCYVPGVPHGRIQPQFFPSIDAARIAGMDWMRKVG